MRQQLHHFSQNVVLCEQKQARNSAVAPPGLGSDGMVQFPTLNDEFKNFEAGNHPLSGIFRQIDTDGNGMLDFNEFYEGLKLLKRSMSEATCRWIFNQVDTDHSGTVSVREWFRGLETLFGFSVKFLFTIL